VSEGAGNWEVLAQKRMKGNELTLKSVSSWVLSQNSDDPTGKSSYVW